MPDALSMVNVEVEGGIGRLTVNRAQANNTLNPALVHQMRQAFAELAGQPAVRGIVLAGAGKAFVAGADVGFFLRNLESGQVERIIQFTKAGHDLLGEIDHCPKPVVACVHGLAVGGGLEMALACDQVFVAPGASLGLPEARLGLYPGLGGTQRTPRKIGPGLAKWMIYTGRTLSAPQARAVGLVEQVVAEQDLRECACRAIHEGLQPAAQAPLSPDMAELEAFFAGHRLEELLAGNVPGGRACQGAVRLVRENGPAALRLAEWLIDEGLKRSLTEGLELELSRLAELFATHDALEGLTAMGKRKPVFEGR